MSKDSSFWGNLAVLRNIFPKLSQSIHKAV